MAFLPGMMCVSVRKGRSGKVRCRMAMATVIYITYKPHSPVTTLPVSPLVGFLLSPAFQGFPASLLLLATFLY